MSLGVVPPFGWFFIFYLIIIVSNMCYIMIDAALTDSMNFFNDRDNFLFFFLPYRVVNLF
jgi:hypothetical protein